jgi:hypothetical protein
VCLCLKASRKEKIVEVVEREKERKRERGVENCEFPVCWLSGKCRADDDAEGRPFPRPMPTDYANRDYSLLLLLLRRRLLLLLSFSLFYRFIYTRDSAKENATKSRKNSWVSSQFSFYPPFLKIISRACQTLANNLIAKARAIGTGK